MTRHPWARTVDQHRRGMAAVQRAVQRPSVWEPGLTPVPKDRECVRCFGLLDPDRNSICHSCWKANQ